MKRVLFFIFFSAFVYANDTIGVGIKEEQSVQKTPLYVVQIFARKDLIEVKDRLKRLDESIKSKITLHQVGDYVVARYERSPFYSQLSSALQDIKNAGFKDAYIVGSTLEDMQQNQLSQASNDTIKETKEDKEQDKKPKIKKNVLTLSQKNQLLQKASEAYNRGDESEAMIYYEMLVASNEAGQKVKNNLCYLYGKRGAWMEAKNIIDNETLASKIIYAYAYGAMETNQENFYTDLSPYIMLDRDGYLLLITGSYFEKREDKERSFGFYKMAYDKNPSDVYNIFAYARALDIKEDAKALSLYKAILQKVSSAHPLYSIVQKRLSEPGG